MLKLFFQFFLLQEGNLCRQRRPTTDILTFELNAHCSYKSITVSIDLVVTSCRLLTPALCPPLTYALSIHRAVGDQL